MPESDIAFMRKAITLGEKGRLTAPPNPWVGCLITKDKQVIGEGYHSLAGEPHAEVVAIANAGKATEGATLYTTLEPCSHTGRTPPCVEACIKAKVSRVVVAVTDPDHKVNGSGIQILRKRGIQVDTGICHEEAHRSLAPYLHHRRTKRPYCVLKSAVSIDGRTAASDGSSQWITGEETRVNAHQLRAESQAIVIGAGTAFCDRPQLTIRHVPPPSGKQPLRVLLDSRGRTPAIGPLFDTTLASTLILTTALAPQSRIKEWKDSGAEVELLPQGFPGGSVDVSEAMALLGKRGILQVMVEGGALLYGSFFRSQLVDHFVVYVGACTLGADALPLFSGPSPTTIDQAHRWHLLNIQRFGNDVRLDYTPDRERTCLPESSRN